MQRKRRKIINDEIEWRRKENRKMQMAEKMETNEEIKIDNNEDDSKEWVKEEETMDRNEKRTANE